MRFVYKFFYVCMVGNIEQVEDLIVAFRYERGKVGVVDAVKMHSFLFWEIVLLCGLR